MGINPPIPNMNIVDAEFLKRLPNSTKIDRGLEDLDSKLMEHGILVEDITKHIPPSILQGHNSMEDIRKHLYGNSDLPILRSEFSDTQNSTTELRRQFLIERLVHTRAVIDYRLLAESMASMGLMGSISDIRIKAAWSSWITSMTDRISKSINGHKSGSKSEKLAPTLRGSAASNKAIALLATTFLAPEKIAHITCITATGEICSPSTGKSSFVTGRGSDGDDDSAFNAETRQWTNADLVDGNSVVGKAAFIHLCDVIGTAVAFEANCNRKSPTQQLVQWKQEERLMVGAELTRMLLSECFIEVDPMSAGNTQIPEITVDPQRDLYETCSLVAPTAMVPVSKHRVFVHAFQHAIEDRGFRSTGFVTMREDLAKALVSVIPSSSFFKLPPMIIPPCQWQSFWRCGYMTRRSPLIRFTGTKDSARDAQIADLKFIYNCMDYLGSTKWVINRVVFEQVESAIKNGVSGVPGIPSPNSSTPTTTRRSILSKNKIEKRTELLRQLREQQKRDSEWPVLMSKFKTARDFKNSKELYFPHSIDFRGRAYPIPAPFNHQGDDLCRSLLRFSEPKILGSRGWFWLRVHAANLFGIDKCSFEDRVAWVTENLESICQIARDPLSHESVKFISSRTDDYWQTVAACTEIRDALTFVNGVESFSSSLPIHQDGSCNGLQHYAALGRDTAGALAVNLIPSNRVEDVYSVVLDIVKERVREDAENCPPDLVGQALIDACPSTFGTLKPSADGHALAKSVLARIALSTDSTLQRKTVKQTVMTICYGVTQIGASDQVHKQLSDLPIAKFLSPAQLAVISSYLSRLVLTSIDTVFSQAMGIKRWFDVVASEMNREKMAISWISPAGVPCRQPYRKQAVTQIRTPVQKITITNEADYDKAPVSGPKQRMGFPPNFIHSLDASHMMLTAAKCKDAGITFAAVHDSYWTHAADVDIMNRIIREEFLAMYYQPILERLREAIVMSLGSEGHRIPPLPPQGDLDLTCVLKSPYFFD